MNYLLLSTNDSGGAGLAVLKTIESLRAKGHNAKLIVLNKYSSSEASIGLYNYNSFFGKVQIWYHRILAKIYKIITVGKPVDRFCFNNVNLNRISATQILKLYGGKPDIISVAWVSDFVDFKTVYELKQITGARVMYIMADNSPITGGCHYPWECVGYQQNCFPCPALKNNNRKAYKTLSHKKQYVTDDMMISGTTNDVNRALKSAVFRNCTIVPSVTIRPNPYCFTREEGLEKWGIDKDNYVILCGAASLNVERKGFSELIKAMSVIKEKGIDISKITIIVAGGSCAPFPDGYEVKCVGSLSFEDLFRAYGCADLFVCPSLEDSGPMMINYGIMQYIPVVAFEMGVALDLIVHKENGYIAKWRDVNDFANGILYCMNRRFKKEDLKTFNDRLAEVLTNERSRFKYLGID